MRISKEHLIELEEENGQNRDNVGMKVLEEES